MKQAISCQNLNITLIRILLIAAQPQKLTCDNVLFGLLFSVAKFASVARVLCTYYCLSMFEELPARQRSGRSDLRARRLFKNCLPIAIKMPKANILSAPTGPSAKHFYHLRFFSGFQAESNHIFAHTCKPLIFSCVQDMGFFSCKRKKCDTQTKCAFF